MHIFSDTQILTMLINTNDIHENNVFRKKCNDIQLFLFVLILLIDQHYRNLYIVPANPFFFQNVLNFQLIFIVKKLEIPFLFFKYQEKLKLSCNLLCVFKLNLTLKTR